MAFEVQCDEFTFPGHMRPPVIGSPDGSTWRKKTTQTGGTPTVQASAGFLALALDATNEAQAAKLYFGNELSYPIGQLLRVIFWAKLSDSIAAAVSCVCGLTSGENDTFGSIGQFALFRCNGSNSVALESKDGVATKTGIATGLSLGSAVRQFCIDFSQGLADVRFHMDNGDGNLRRVAPKTTFSLAGYAGGLQPYFQIQKSANAATGTLSLQKVQVDWKLPTA